MPTPRESITEEHLVDDFAGVNEQVERTLGKLEIQPLAPLHAPDDDGTVVEPVYAYHIYASS